MKKNNKIEYYGYTFPAYNTPIEAHKKDKHKKAVLVKYEDAIKLVKFGLRGMEDHTQHYDEKRRENYLSRSAGIKDKQAGQPKTIPFQQTIGRVEYFGIVRKLSFRPCNNDAVTVQHT